MEESVDDIKKSIFRDLPMKRSEKELPSYEELDKIKQLELDNKKYKVEVAELSKRVKELFAENHQLREQIAELNKSGKVEKIAKHETWKEKLGVI